MEIQFQEYDGSFYALNPRIVRESNQLTMKLDEQSCTHFLLFSRVPAGAADLSDPETQALLRAMADRLLDAEDELLTEDTTVRCVSYRDYRMNNYAVELPGRIAEYTVYGCRFLRSQETLCVALPQRQMCRSAIVSITVSYRLDFLSGTEGKYGRQRPCYAARFEKVPSYPDGGVVYTLDDLPFQFPITREMLGETVYIDAGRGAPKFQTTVSGLNLKKI